MARPYSVDLRERVVRWVESGASRRTTAAKFEVSVSFVVKLWQRWRQRGTVQADRLGGGRRSPLAAHAERVQALVAAAPGPDDRRTAPPAGGRGHRHQPVRDRPLARRRRSDSKKRTRHAAEQDRPDVAAARCAWRQWQPTLSPERLVFLDETWAIDRNGPPLWPRPAGARCRAAVPHGHWKTTTFLPALRHDGLSAPCCSTARSTAPASGLCRAGPVPDTRPATSSSWTTCPPTRSRACARRSRPPARLLYLPPYSPDFNPIEMAFAKLKALLRNAASRTVEALWQAIGRLLDAFTPAECARYLAHAGYVPSHRETL